MSSVAKCAVCGNFVQPSKIKDGACPICARQAAEQIQREAQAARELEELVRLKTRERAEHERLSAAAAIPITTETAHNLPVAERLDIVTAEVVYGMHIFKDIASSFRDVFGGRSQVLQSGLRDARKTALTELRQEAYALGADAVVGVSLAYSQISGEGRNMLVLVVSGTAVKLEVKP